MKIFLSSLIGLTALTLISCDSKEKLATDLSGSWAGTPERLGEDVNGTSTVVEVFNFTKDQGSPSGTVIISAMISLTGTIQPSDGFVQPYALSEAAVATAEGTWSAVDDDDVMIKIDPQTVTVNVDPKSVTYNTNLLTEEQEPLLDSIKPRVYRGIQNRITKEILTRFTELNHLDDVKIKGNLLKYEIGNKHYVMSRQGEIMK